MTPHIDQKLILSMDIFTGKIVLESDREQSTAKKNGILEFRTGLDYEVGTAARIKAALTKRGIKVTGVQGRCINISKDWLVQILAILYYGLSPEAKSNCLDVLTNAADNNPEWKLNYGIGLQKLHQMEYWSKVERFHRARQTNDASTQQKRKSLKILIVDDNVINRKIIHKLLSPFGDCDLATDGSEAIKAFVKATDEGEKYDLITLDIMMPVMDGKEVLKHIRNLEEERRIVDPTKIIMTTAMDNSKVIFSAFSEQCDGYLIKPIRKKPLIDLLCELDLLTYCVNKPTAGGALSSL